MDISLIYEDNDVLVLNKPAGMLVHSDGRDETSILTDWIEAEYPALVGIGEPQRISTGEVVDRPGIVHRLDKDTSGVIAVAKHAESFTHLKTLFQTGGVLKTYHAFVYGRVKDETGRIDAPIGKHPKDFRRRLAGPDARGTVREAETNWSVRVSTSDVSFLEVKPKTGRTHQIRVHMTAIGHPIVADPLYAPSRPHLLGFERLALHARTISFKTVSGTDVTAEAAYPSDLDRKSVV